MKLVKLFNKLSAVALAASLVVGFASCSTTTDDPFNPNAPLTLEEYVKSEIKKAIENGGAPAKPEDPSKPGKPSGSGSLKEPKSLEFHVNADSTNAENTMIFVKYDRSAYGAEEEVKVTDAELNLYINDVKVKTYNEIVFVLDEYGTEITSRGPIEDPKAMKEYKAKLSVGKAVKSGETVKIELVKASVVKVGAASDKITLANLQFALIDTDPSVDYYKELAPNAEQFQNICTLEDLTPGEDTESKPGEEQKPSENPTPTPDEKPEPEDSGLLPKAADLSWGTPVSVAGSSFESATDNSSIKITYVSNKDTAQYYKFKMMCGNGNENELFAGDATGFTIDKESVDNLDNLHGCGFDVAPSETPAVITYKPSTEEWAKIKAGEFRLIGNGAKITKIELETGAGGENNAGGEGDNGAGESGAGKYTYTAIWTDEKAVTWGNGIDVSHENFDVNVKGVRVTYKVTGEEACFKTSVCSPWVDATVSLVDGATQKRADDNAINTLGDVDTVDTASVLFADGIIEKIVGQGIEDFWGGLNIQGQNVTITKIETIK